MLAGLEVLLVIVAIIIIAGTLKAFTGGFTFLFSAIGWVLKGAVAMIGFLVAATGMLALVVYLANTFLLT